LAAIGDVLIHNTVYQDAADPQTGGYNFKPMLAPVREFLLKPDVLVANQESITGGKELGLSSYPMFNSPHEVGDALLDAGVDLVTMANNHTLDKGEKGVLSATAYWDKLGIPYTGAFRSEEDRQTLRALTSQGISFSFLSYTYGTNGIAVPQDKPYLVNLIDPERIRQEVEAAKKAADVSVVAMHWGAENQLAANADQKALAAKLAEWGVDIIIGTHPHVLQTFEWIGRPDGSRTLVMYSLGNFLSAQSKLPQLLGGIGQVEVVKTVDNGKTTIALQSPEFIPTYNKYKNWRTYRVIPLQKLEQEDWKTIGATWESAKQKLQAVMPELTIHD
jgi:poly-gamma-glutamate synthesis protein (capsule biosynthesis protein)